MKLLLQLTAAVLVDVIFIIVIAVVQPVSAEDYSYKYTEVGGGQYVMRRRCEDDGQVFMIGALGLASVPIVVAIYLAFQTRNVKSGFTENQPILISLYTLTIAAVVLLPLTFILGEDYMVMTFLIVSIGILLVSTVSVLVFMLPKIYAHRYPPVLPNPMTSTFATSADNKAMTQNLAMNNDEIEKEMEALQREILSLKIENSRLAASQRTVASTASEEAGDGAEAPSTTVQSEGSAALKSEADGGAAAPSTTVQSEGSAALNRLADQMEGLPADGTPNKEDGVQRLNSIMTSPATPGVNELGGTETSEGRHSWHSRTDPVDGS